MTSPLEWFGLARDADERALKRAYAQRLRTTRPDDDPQGFQQLHAMYQRALAQCRAHSGDAVEFPVEPVATAVPSIAPDQAGRAPASNVTALATTPLSREIIERLSDQALAMAAQGHADALRAWLLAQPELWSLQAKSKIGRRCVEKLFHQVPAVPSACLQALLQFFDLDRVQTGIDAAALARLSRRMQLAWELQPSHIEELRRRFGDADFSPRATRRLLAELQRPFHWPSMLLRGLLPRSVRTRVRFLAGLSQGHPHELPPSFDPKVVRFWMEAATPRVTRARLVLGITRWMTVIAMAALLGLGPMWRDPMRPDPSVLIGLVAMAAAPGLIWLAFMLYLPLDAWHGHPEHVRVRWPWLNLLLVPLLSLAGIGLKLWRPDELIFIAPMIPAVWLSLRRFWRRSATGDWLSPNALRVAIVLSVPVLRSLVHEDVTCPFFAVLALVPWGWDLWRQRAVLRVVPRAA